MGENTPFTETEQDKRSETTTVVTTLDIDYMVSHSLTGLVKFSDFDYSIFQVT